METRGGRRRRSIMTDLQQRALARARAASSRDRAWVVHAPTQGTPSRHRRLASVSGPLWLGHWSPATASVRVGRCPTAAGAASSAARGGRPLFRSAWGRAEEDVMRALWAVPIRPCHCSRSLSDNAHDESGKRNALGTPSARGKALLIIPYFGSVRPMVPLISTASRISRRSTCSWRRMLSRLSFRRMHGVSR